MGWWSKFKDDILGIDPPKPTAPDPALAQATDALAKTTAATQTLVQQSLDAQKAATAQAEAAMIPLSDNESARAARDDRARELKQSSPFGIGLSKKLGAAPSGFRVLSGS